jgi:Fe-S-cluster containining protein
MIDRLNKIYLLYDQIMDSATWSCGPTCARCCTCNVTLTSLEARFMTVTLPAALRGTLHTAVTQSFPAKRYIPQMTTNQFARLCMEGKDIPDEENDPSWGKCPLLENDLCTVYDVRPFGCRALISQTDCRDTGFAQMPPWMLTVNNLFLQAIEHLDQNGYSGNLSDMLQMTLSGNDLTHQDMQNHDPKSDALFVKNEPIKCLMIPPEHRERMDHIVKNLSDLLNAP